MPRVILLLFLFAMACHPAPRKSVRVGQNYYKENNNRRMLKMHLREVQGRKPKR
jgi:hypothetical protein